MRSSPYMVTRGTDSIHLGGKWDFLLRWLTNEQWALLSGTTTLRSPQGTVNSEQKHEQRGYMGEGLKNAGGQAWWYFPVMSALRRQRRPVSLSLKPSWSTQFDKPRLCKETRPCIKTNTAGFLTTSHTFSTASHESECTIPSYIKLTQTC